MCSRGVGYLKLVVHLRAEDCHAAWCFDSQLHALTVDGEYGNPDVFPEKQALLAFAAQNKHA